MTKKQLNMKSTEDRLKAKLDKMATIQETIAAKQEKLNELIAALLNLDPKLKDAHMAIQSELAELQDDAVEMESEIKELGLKAGETVKGEKLQAVYNQGRRSWDNQMLENWAILLPAIMEAKKAGAPYISLKEVKGE